MKSAWIYFICVFMIRSSEGSFYDIFGPCCHEGVLWSSASYRCDNYPAPVSNILDNDQAACLSIIEVCCIKQTQVLSCEDGKNAALNDRLCAVMDTEPGAEQFRECCQCCHLGKESRSFTPACQSPGLGEPCDSKYRECCKGQGSGNLTFVGVTIGTRTTTSTTKPDIATNSIFDDTLPNNSSYNETDNEFDSEDNNDNDNGADDKDEEDKKKTNDEKENKKTNDDEEEETDESTSVDDIDECLLFQPQICSHICVNTVIGFYCDCSDGFRLSPNDNRTCEPSDIIPTTTTTTKPTTIIISSTTLGRLDNPIKDKEYDCDGNNPCQQRCIEKPGGQVECRCNEGYLVAADYFSCEDINECAEGLSACAPGQNCINTEGRYTCISTTCPSGYDLDKTTGRCRAGEEVCAVGFDYRPTSGKCEDINECGLGIDSCGTGERCENAIGSYACRRERHCGTGYTLDEQSQRCMDNDECLMGTHNCQGRYTCQNIRGSFRCVPTPCPDGSRFDRTQGKCQEFRCPAGLKPNAAGSCIDINECDKFGQRACRSHQRCVNTRGSFYCRNFINCPPGYEPTENSGCQDVNECERGTDKCGIGQECVNRQGTYFCQCPRGMRHDSAGRCVDVDECSYGASICPSKSQCVNTVGSFKCECVDGLVSDGHDSCTDVDECQEVGICQQSCVNVLGTFFCSCNRGYQLRDDKRSCEDIDECTQFRGRKGRSGVCGGYCVNFPGSYKCQCPEGWRLKPDDRSCEDINECKERTAYCPHQESLCINTKGGYKCPIVRCPEGYIKTNSSGQKNSIKCRRVTTHCPECKRGLISRTYNFISFASNVLVPAPLFSMTGSRLVDKYYSWQLDLLTARPLRSGVSKADASYFSLEKSRDFARVTLLRQISGPQDLVLKMTMNVTSYFKGFEGMAESRIYLYVTKQDNNR